MNSSPPWLLMGSSSVAVVPSSPLAAMSGAGRVYAISLAAAAKEIWIANSYFLPDDAAVGLLVAAVKRGVDVRVIVPSDEQNDVPATKAAGRSAFGPLLEGGVKIYEYQPTMFHLKTMVVDGIFSTVGSANFDDRSFHLNEEINLFVVRRRVRRADEGALPAGSVAVPPVHASRCGRHAR